MKRFLYVAVLLIVTGLAVGHRCFAQNGPGESNPGDGAILKNPFDPTPPASKTPTSKAPNYGGAAPFLEPLPIPGGGQPGTYASLLPKNEPDINQDIQVTEKSGPWVILLQSYRGPEAPKMAREMVMELRNTYRLKAFTYNFSAAERKAEFERVKGIIEKHKQFLQQNNMPLDHPIRVKHVIIEENQAVLLCGYATENEARRDLERIRKLTPLDPKKVKLDAKYFQSVEKTEKGEKDLGTEGVYLNPFKRGCVVHNPEVKLESAPEPQHGEGHKFEVMRKLNSREKYSLLACKKKYTLAIKEFQIPAELSTGDAPVGVMEKMGLKSKTKEKNDYAATNAHNLAETLRKRNLDAYVLHTEFSSVVCVGGYESLEDPNLRSMQGVLENVSRALPAVGMFQKALPMEIPRK